MTRPRLKTSESSSSPFAPGEELPVGPSREDLSRLAESRRADYRNAAPFPHVAIDGFLDTRLMAQVAREFPDAASSAWRTYNHHYSKKYASENFADWGKTTQRLITYLNGAEFLEFLERLTGIEGLIPDPYFCGGGLHMIGQGGFLGIHADFNWHERMKLDRRINLLLYLNEDWQPQYGGALELWTSDMKTKAVAIEPLFNRLVLFNTTDRSFHGHPEPLAVPNGVHRRSIALYYYTNGRPESEISDPHSTLYRRRPGERNAGIIHPNLFFQVLPPFLYHALARLKRKLGV